MSVTPTPTPAAPGAAPVPVITTPPVVTPVIVAPVPAPIPVPSPTPVSATASAPVLTPGDKRVCEICRKTFIADEDDLHICHECQKKSKGKRFWILYMAELTVALIVIVPLWSDVIVKGLESTGLLQGETGFTIKVTVQALLGTMILVLRKVYTTPANTAEAATMQATATANAANATTPATALNQKLQDSALNLTQAATGIQASAAAYLAPASGTAPAPSPVVALATSLK